jgi:hypothetical protein
MEIGLYLLSLFRRFFETNYTMSWIKTAGYLFLVKLLPFLLSQAMVFYCTLLSLLQYNDCPLEKVEIRNPESAFFNKGLSPPGLSFNQRTLLNLPFKAHTGYIKNWGLIN